MAAQASVRQSCERCVHKGSAGKHTNTAKGSTDTLTVEALIKFIIVHSDNRTGTNCHFIDRIYSLIWSRVYTVDNAYKTEICISSVVRVLYKSSWVFFKSRYFTSQITASTQMLQNSHGRLSTGTHHSKRWRTRQRIECHITVLIHHFPCPHIDTETAIFPNLHFSQNIF